MTRQVLGTLIVTVTLLAGCGEGEPVTSNPDLDRAAIQERVVTYVRAMLGGDGEKACAQLTPEFRRATDERARTAGLPGCVETFSLHGEAIGGTAPKGFAAELADPDRVLVTLSGDRAEAALVLASGRVSRTRTTLRRVGAQWLIDGLGVTRTGG